MPDLASRKLASTSFALLPMEETIPIPVTTTRRMQTRSSWLGLFHLRRQLLGVEEAHLKILGAVYMNAVREHLAVADAHMQLALDHALHIDLVADEFRVRRDLAAELDLADAQGAPAPRRAGPAQKEADQLPHCVQPQAARHHRVAAEMALEEPAL